MNNKILSIIKKSQHSIIISKKILLILTKRLKFKSILRYTKWNHAHIMKIESLKLAK